MSDPNPPDLRWVLERNHAETSADIARLEAQIAGIPVQMERYVLAQVYEARERARDAREDARDARIKRIEDDDSAKVRGVRTAWLAAAGAIASTIGVEVINAVTRGTGH